MQPRQVPDRVTAPQLIIITVFGGQPEAPWSQGTVRWCGGSRLKQNSRKLKSEPCKIADRSSSENVAGVMSRSCRLGPLDDEIIPFAFLLQSFRESNRGFFHGPRVAGTCHRVPKELDEKAVAGTMNEGPIAR